MRHLTVVRARHLALYGWKKWRDGRLADFVTPIGTCEYVSPLDGERCTLPAGHSLIGHVIDADYPTAKGSE